jgi:hypothetical protein
MDHGVAVLTVNADASACQPVTLVGLGVRMANDDFWQALADALSIDEITLWALLPHSPGAQ